jgi:carboxyl-terminal processing protease
MRKYRSASAAAFVVVVCALVGGFFGRSALSAQDQVPDQYRVFAAALTAIESTYVGETPSDRLVYSAITGMLQTLDPHSSFYDPRSYAQMRERQEGRYYGLGISINVTLDGDVTVANVFEDSPAHEAGMRRGDVIARIESLDTKGWTIEQAVGRLRGPKGTSVPIALRRGGYDKLIELQVRRDEVHIRTVPAAVMLDATTGIIWFKGDFGETSNEEIGAALKDLTQKGMKRLIFDLRDNPGGSLPAAIAVANRFLPRGDLIVYTRGRTQNSDQDYRATETSQYLTLPMVTLVNRRSASASEIVSGALQDHDRSLIVGETTFGKALVQSVYRVAQNAGASITTARYYTPSGRLIQRPWDSSFDEYMTYTLRDQDANKTHQPEDLKLTDGGRKVYSGGGVDPDYRLDGPIDGFSPTRMGRAIASREMFDAFSQRFSRRGDLRITASTSAPARDLAANFEITDAMLDEFKAIVQKSPVPFDEASWQKDLPFIRAELRKEIDTDLFGAAVAYQNLARADPQVQYALTLFPEAQKLLELEKTSRPSTARARR